MVRLAGTLVALSCFAAPMEASLVSTNTTARKDSLQQLLPKSGLSGTESVPPPPLAELTTESEVTLDGRGCAYKDVPPTATIAKIVLASDGRTIVRIEFRSR